YLNYLIFGFDETYDKIYHLKNEILDNRLLDRFFINCTTRTVFKHTFYYSKIIDNFLKFNTLCSYDNYKNKKTVYFKYLSNVSDNNLLAKAELQDILN